MSNSVIVEAGDASVVYASPRDPYTRRLLAAANLRPRRDLVEAGLCSFTRPLAAKVTALGL